jgi:hypothetical protein
MQHAVLNHATLQVADTMGVSGRVTAKSVKRGFCAKKQSHLSRICVLAIFGFVVLLAPVPARAQAPPSVPAEIAAPQKQVAALQTQVSAQQAQITSLQNQLTAAKPVLALAPFVTVDPNLENGVKGPNITFKGANIHIVSGSGATDDNLFHGGSLTGLGNLIIGYDEPRLDTPPVDRSGSHNLVVGRYHSFTSSAFGGLVAGTSNTISREAASVTGGKDNTASGFAASVSGGFTNTASGFTDTVTGGLANTASGIGCSVSGGDGNIASAANFDSDVGASVSGGFGNTASGLAASVSGGSRNTAGGVATVVIGGSSVIDNNSNSIAPQPPFP